MSLAYFTRYDMRKLQGTKLSSCTLRCPPMVGYDVWVSHPAIFFELFWAKLNLTPKSTPMPIFPTTVRFCRMGRMLVYQQAIPVERY